MTSTNVQEQATIEVFTRNIDVLKPEVAGLTSGRYNAKYNAKDLITYAMMQCAESTYAETMVQNIQRVCESAGPIPHWFRDRLRNVPEAAMPQICHFVLAASAQSARNDGLLGGPLAIPLDVHLIPVYSDGPEEDLHMRSVRLPGTNDAEGYVTAQNSRGGPAGHAGHIPDRQGRAVSLLCGEHNRQPCRRRLQDRAASYGQGLLRHRRNQRH